MGRKRDYGVLEFVSIETFDCFKYVGELIMTSAAGAGKTILAYNSTKCSKGSETDHHQVNRYRISSDDI